MELELFGVWVVSVLIDYSLQFEEILWNHPRLFLCWFWFDEEEVLGGGVVACVVGCGLLIQIYRFPFARFPSVDVPSRSNVIKPPLPGTFCPAVRRKVHGG